MLVAQHMHTHTPVCLGRLELEGLSVGIQAQVRTTSHAVLIRMETLYVHAGPISYTLSATVPGFVISAPRRGYPPAFAAVRMKMSRAENAWAESGQGLAGAHRKPASSGSARSAETKERHESCGERPKWEDD